MFLIEHDNNITAVFHIDVTCNMLICLWIAITNAVTASYFFRRAWSLAGRKWWLLIPAIVAILASLGLGCALVAHGFRVPHTRTLADLQRLLVWFEKLGGVAKAWAVLFFSIDVLVCISNKSYNRAKLAPQYAVFIFLACTKNELRKEHNKPLLRRIYLITTETMLPPALLAIGIFISFELHGVEMLSLDRAMFWMMPNMLFLAVLHSLVARQRLATVIFAPNSSRGAEEQDSTELRRIANMRDKQDHDGAHGQHEKTLSYDSVRKSWINDLTHSLEQKREVDVEGMKALVPNSSQSDSRVTIDF
ncbi:hypothetical protein QFC19_007865 [Naganishia cerealis]|uniref:Uncharacterized protein n=1 Tax=Naganishia cerealis TaxID=610337 RepID=A0ACC2V7W6_9TREE|nr:hypothetical protein QFC19_007865 [Naganishia cerealis]